LLTGEVGVPGDQQKRGWQTANDCLRAASLYHTWKEGTVCSIRNGVVDY
jgi:hypothetical protein